MFAGLAAPIAFVAHDAGAANHIVAWLQVSGCRDVRACMVGPAQAIWQLAFANTPLLGLADALSGARTLVSGTGWASDLEHAARRLARVGGLHSIAVVDHWTQYPERFERGGERILPDVIWVTDEYARQLARSQLLGVEVLLQPNAYMDRLLGQVTSRPAGAPERVLYVMEPIRQYWGGSPQPGEFDALDYFLGQRERLGLGGATPVRLRPHPSDPAGKYDAWIERAGSPSIALDPTQPLAQSLGWATTVVGCQTYAMVLALVAGRRVISSLPPVAPPCVLPHRQIIRLAELDSLKGHL